MAGAPEQIDWRDWGADLLEEPAERARMAEVKLAEALEVLDVLKAPSPASLTSEERRRAGELVRGGYPLVRTGDAAETLLMTKSNYLDYAARAARPDPKVALRERVCASFEASGGSYGFESTASDPGSGEGAGVLARPRAGGTSTPVAAPGKVVHAIMDEEGLVSRKSVQVARRRRWSSYAASYPSGPPTPRPPRTALTTSMRLSRGCSSPTSRSSASTASGRTSRRRLTASMAGRFAGDCPCTPTRRNSWSVCSPTSSRRWPRPKSAPGGAH